MTRRPHADARVSDFGLHLISPLLAVILVGAAAPGCRAGGRPRRRSGRAGCRSRPGPRPPRTRARACPATCSGVPEKANRSSTSSGISAPAPASSPAAHQGGRSGQRGPAGSSAGRVERADDRQVHGDLGPGPPPGGGAVLGDHGDRARDQPDSSGRPARRPSWPRPPAAGPARSRPGWPCRPPSARRRSGPARAVPRGPHAPSSSGGTRAGQRVAQPGAGLQPELLPGEPGLRRPTAGPGRRRRPRAAGQRPRGWPMPTALEPGAAGQAEVGPAAGGGVERRDLARRSRTGAACRG